MWAIQKPYGGPDTKIRRGSRALVEAEWDRIATQLAALSFWSQPARLLPEPHRHPWQGEWKVEGYNGDRYHSVSRVYDDERLRPVASAFIDLARPLFSAAAKWLVRRALRARCDHT